MATTQSAEQLGERNDKPKTGEPDIKASPLTYGEIMPAIVDDYKRTANGLASLSASVQAAQLEAHPEPELSDSARAIGEAAVTFGLNLVMAKFKFGSHTSTLVKRAIWSGLAVTSLGEVVPEIPNIASDLEDRLKNDRGFSGEDLTNLGSAAIEFTGHAALSSAAGFVGAKAGLALFHPGDVYKGIPALRRDGFLPEGVHIGSWDEFTSRFGYNDKRREVSSQLLVALHDLKDAGAKDVWIGGSLVTRKLRPSDFDLGYANFPDQLKKMPILWDREMMKDAYNGEMWPDCLSYFRLNNRVGKKVGVVQLDLDTLPPRISQSPAASVMEHYQLQAEEGLRNGQLSRWSPALDQTRLFRVMNELKEHKLPVPTMKIGGSETEFSIESTKGLDQKFFLRTDIPPEPIVVRSSMLKELNGL